MKTENSELATGKDLAVGQPEPVRLREATAGQAGRNASATTPPPSISDNEATRAELIAVLNQFHLSVEQFDFQTSVTFEQQLARQSPQLLMEFVG